jgi:DNA uptake protein ComE-like DNA-binding protein
MKSELRELFSFTASERNGTIVLLILIMMLSVFISLQGKFVSLPKENFAQFDAFLAMVDEKQAEDSIAYSDKYSNSFEERKDKFPTASEEAGQHSVFHSKELFNFNPNGLPVDDWVRLGLSPAQARSIKNFETKGGNFKTKEDVKKLFVISEERYRELEPFIVLPENDKLQNAQPRNTEPVTRNPIPSIVELNTADSSLLTTVKGIGPVFAKRIVAYRDRLGGFYSTDQLTEVFGMDAEKFAEIKTHVKADSTYIRKININSIEASELKKFPYLTPTVATALVNYRKSHGNYKSVAGIRSCALITEALYKKIAPYFTI